MYQVRYRKVKNLLKGIRERERINCEDLYPKDWRRLKNKLTRVDKQNERWMERQKDRQKQLTLLISESPCPNENPLLTPVIPCTSPPSLAIPCTYPLCHLSAPVIPCTCPLSSPASLCHPLYTHCHPKSSPVIPRTCLCHPCLSPSSPTQSLAARWSVMLTIHNLFSCRKSRNLNYPYLYIHYFLPGVRLYYLNITW